MEFVLIIIEVLACFVLGSLLFKPAVRKAFPAEVFGVFFYLEGIWAMANYIISSIWPANHVMSIIKYIFTLVIAIFMIVHIVKSTKKKKRMDKNERQAILQNKKRIEK